MGKLDPGGILYADRPPGNYRVLLGTSAFLFGKDMVRDLTLDAGQVVYVKMSIGMWGPIFDLIPPDEASTEILSMHYDAQAHTQTKSGNSPPTMY
jgi:hypothetical protein